MKIVAFANQKGGVAKTTTAVNVAGIFADKGRKTLLVDTDPQCNATSFLLRDGYPRTEETLTALYESRLCSNPNLIRDTRMPNLKLIAGGFRLAGMVNESYSLIRNHERLASYLHDFATDFDVVFIDCPPDIGIYTLNAFIASQYIIVPMIPERLSLEGYAQLQEKVEIVHDMGVDTRILGVVITLLQGRLTTHKEWKRQIEKMFGPDLLGVIHSSADMKRFSEMRQLVSESIGKTERSYLEHLRLAKEIGTRIEVPIE